MERRGRAGQHYQRNDPVCGCGKREVRIYVRPEEGVPYVIGADTKERGRDFYAATVINNITGGTRRTGSYAGGRIQTFYVSTVLFRTILQ